VDLQTALHIAIIGYLVLRDVVILLRQIILQLGGTLPPNGDGTAPLSK